MTRNDQRAVWAIALKEYGAQALEEKVLGFLVPLLSGKLAEKLPRHVSPEGLAQLVGLLLANVQAGERPLLGALRTMNRRNFHGGIHAVHRHGRGFPMELALMQIRHSNGLLGLAGNLLLIIAGVPAEAGVMGKIYQEFADCLPPVEPPCAAQSEPAH